DRRVFLAAASSLLAAPLAAGAQQPKVPRVGYLVSRSGPGSNEQAFQDGLRELGYVERQNIVIERGWAGGDPDRLPDLATELVQLKVDVVLTGGTPAALGAKKATNTIPVVAVAMGDPVEDGLVASLARPGGNITGSTLLGPELAAKRLSLLKEAVPRGSPVAALWHGAYGERTMREMLRTNEVAAQALGVQRQLVEVRGPTDFDNAFAAMTRERASALIVLSSPMLFAEHRRIVALAAKHRLPA